MESAIRDFLSGTLVMRRFILLLAFFPLLHVSCGSSSSTVGAPSGGGSSSGNEGNTFEGPDLTGMVVYLDAQANGTADAGDQLLVRFDEAVTLDGALASDFELTSTGDSLGSGASVAQGGSPEEVVITLGNGASFRVQGDHVEGQERSGSPSGLRMSTSVSRGSVQSVASGLPARTGISRDLVPGFFHPGAQFGPWSVQALATADLDGDGKLDLAVANGGGEANRVLFGDGFGNFQDSGQALGNADSHGVAIGDLDGDGDLDLVFANHDQGRDQSAVWTNDGSGNFQFLLAFGEGRATSVALGDLDADGDLDLVEGRGNGRGNQAWRNDGTGQLTSWGDPMATNQTHTVQLADLDRDGDLDLVEGNSGPNRVWLWDRGSSAFVDSGQRIGSGSTHSIGVADLDCDGDLDLVVAGRDPAWGWWNDGSAQFDSGQRLANAATDEVAVVDLNGDGRPDILAGNANRQANEVWYQDLAMSLVDTGIRLGDSTTTSVVVGDFDQDGDLDFVAGNDGEPSRVWLNSLTASGGPLRFQAAAGVGDGETAALLVEDLDRDGRADLVEGDVRGGRIWYGLGDGAFEPVAVDLADFDTTSLASADLDRDGSRELIQAQDSLTLPGGATLVWEETPGGRSYQDTALTAERTFALATADADGDGDVDLFRGNEGVPESRLWHNDGQGGLTPDVAAPFGSDAVSCAEFVDLDRDGDLDLVVGTRSDGVRWFLRQGDDLVAGPHLAAGLEVYSLVLGDLDRDGRVDLVLGLDTGAEIYLGDGAGGFGALHLTLGTDAAKALALGDLNADGGLDLVVGKAVPTAEIWLASDPGQFEAGPSLDDGDCTSVHLTDLNCDGLLDILFADMAIGGSVRIWLGE